ncbi:hypothetical protein SBV1_1710038 [Verrucomicrobia bacterium]|nr:hypothetical protein SBV1_1710038 [Verrucomicrobiota bacterium]
MLKGPQQLCFDCHEEKDMVAVKAHAQNGTKSCVACHDPHWGTDKYLLKPPAKTSPAGK